MHGRFPAQSLYLHLKHFCEITHQQQLQFVHTYSISNLPPLVYRTSSEELERYKEIKNVFKDFNPLLFQINLYSQSQSSSSATSMHSREPSIQPHLSSKAIIPTTVEIEEGDTIVVNNRETYTLPQATLIQTKAYIDLVEKSEAENQKFTQLTEIFSDIIIHYSSLVAIKDRSSFENKFRTLFPSFAKRLLMGEPKMVSTNEFQLLGSLLTQFSLFILSLNNGDLSFDKNEQENVRSKLLVSLEMLFTKINLYIQDEGLLGEPIVACLSSILVEAGLSFAIKPYHLYLILEHLIEDPMNEIHLVNSDVPLEAFPCDPEVSEALGKAFSSLAKELIKMSSKNNLNFIENEMICLIESKKKSFADYIQKFFHQFKIGSSTFLPFSIIHHLLFKKVNDTFVALFDYGHIEPSANELEARLKKLETKISIKILNLIQQEMKEKSTLASWVTDSTAF